MKVLKNFSIRTRLFLAFGIIVGIGLLRSLFLLSDVNELSRKAEDALALRSYSNVLINVKFLDNAFTSISQAYASTGSEVVKVHYAEREETYKTWIKEASALKLPSDMIQTFNSAVSVRDQMSKMEAASIALVEIEKRSEAKAILDSEDYKKLKDQFIDIVDKQYAIDNSSLAEFDRYNKSALYTMAIMTKIFLIAILVLGSLSIYIISWPIIKALKEIELSALAISRGDLNARVVVTGDDEVGRAAIAFNKMAVVLNEERMQEKLKKVTENVGI